MSFAAFQQTIQRDANAFTLFKHGQEMKQLREIGKGAGQGIQVQHIQPAIISSAHSELGARVRQVTQNTPSGVVTFLPGIPLPPINEHTVIPKNQLSVEYAPQIHPAVNIRRLERLEDTRPLIGQGEINLRRMVGQTQNNIPLMSMAINAPASVGIPDSLRSSNTIAHPLNRMFVQNDDPYNQVGREFFSGIGNPSGVSRETISMGHITGEKRGLSRGHVSLRHPDDPRAQPNAADEVKAQIHDNGL